MAENSIDFLNNHYHTLTKGEQKLADHLIGNLEQAIQMNVKELADASGTSVATVIRFAKHLGFDGYVALRLKLAQNFSASDDYVLDIQNSDSSIQTQIQKVLSASMESIRQTMAGIDYGLLEDAAHKIIHSGKILFFGVGSSGIVCDDAMVKFQRIKKTAYSVKDLHTAIVILSNFGPDDLVIGVSHSGKTHETCEIMKLARKEGISTIAMTTFLSSPIGSLGDLVFNTKSRESSQHKVAVTSRMSQFAMLDALFFAALISSYDNSLDNILKISDIMGKL